MTPDDPIPYSLTEKARRKLPPGMVGKLQKRGGTGAIAPGSAELGWLTPLSASATGGYWHFRCRCGAEVTKETRQVRNSAKAGRTCRCGPACTHREPK